MHTLSLNFTILKFCGLWRPLLWFNGWKFVLYNCYTFLVVSIVCTFVVSESIELFASFDSAEEFVHGSFMLLTMLGMSGKMINLLKNRQEIIDLMNVLKNDPCNPRNAIEMKIQSECERRARSNAFWYTTLTASTASFMLLRSGIVDIPERNLPFKGWLPYNHDSTQIAFFFAYFHQCIATGVGAIINSSFDTLVPGFIMQTCGQIKILKYRISSVPRILEERIKSFGNLSDDEYRRKSRFHESELMAECIGHHVQILQLAVTSNKIFGFVIFLQFAVSSIVLCVSVYEVSKVELFTAEFTATVMYLTSMLVQIFIFCYYGGELSLESVDICQALYRMSWSSFGNRTKKNLIVMMIRSQRPITFVCCRVIRLSLDSFTSLVKLSYSVYNVLSNDR